MSGGAVVVTSRGAGRLDRGHPWVYRDDVARAPDEPGAYAIRDEAGRALGSGFYSPASKIALRAFSRDEVRVDAAFFRERFERAAAYRSRWGLTPDGPSNCYRLLHAEGDGVPGLVVDRYADILVVQVSNAGVDRYTDEVATALIAAFQPRGILARNDVRSRRLERLPRGVAVLYGDVPGEVEVRENGSRFVVDLREGQKTGAYLDQKASRALAAAHARGRTLDLFTYQGWFAVQLARAAEHVLAVDSSEPALEQLRRNARLNGIESITTERSDVFDYLDTRAETYHTIVLDPPPFAKRKRDVRGALRGYTRLNAQALRHLEPGGLLFTFSCSHNISPAEFEGAVRRAAAGARRRCRIAGVVDQPPDHPHVLTIPESGYLKGLVVEALD
ncbi:MAG: class I SAM-dependent rRNA methyltransferase [Gemmatimonadota bacterium]